MITTSIIIIYLLLVVLMVIIEKKRGGAFDGPFGVGLAGLTLFFMMMWMMNCGR